MATVRNKYVDVRGARRTNRERMAEQSPNQARNGQRNDNEKAVKNWKTGNEKAGGKRKNHTGVIIAEPEVLSLICFSWRLRRQWIGKQTINPVWKLHLSAVSSRNPSLFSQLEMLEMLKIFLSISHVSPFPPLLYLYAPKSFIYICLHRYHTGVWSITLNMMRC